MLEDALRSAIAAATSCGDRLRADFHANADADATHRAEVETEREIREQLAAIRPDWGFIGEETGRRVPRNGARHVWLVDPIDGTSDHVRGVRGGAVSIAAVVDGVPVLGVVHAFAAPDDHGDLFAWAEGCGPVTRNGVPLTRPLLPAALGSDDVVLLSWKSQRKIAANLARIHPARMRAVPSVAWRLALLAAGEGSAAVSLNGACAWDFAGGHALLVGAGGTLVDERGEAVRYDADGWSHPAACFGGHPETARHLAVQDWTGVLQAPRNEAALLFPQRGESIRDAGLLARAQGCLLGQVAGDSLGGRVEFSEPAHIQRHFPQGVRDLADGGTWNLLAGQPTDDSELALALARTLTTGAGHDVETVAQAYLRWLDSPAFDIGMTCSQAMRGGRGAPQGETASRMRAAATPTSKSNGSLMRISPLGIFAHALPAARVAEMSRQESRLTHPSEACQDACAAFTVAVAHAISRGDGPQAAYAAALAWSEAHACGEVVEWVRDAQTRTTRDFCTHMGFVQHALQNAFFQLLHAESLEEGVVATVGRGGDTDTNAAIAGALLGAVHGREAVPARWRKSILSCHAAPGTRRPRPHEYWPADALVLAERLLVVGAAAR